MTRLRSIRFTVPIAALLLGACATVSTRVVPLNPAQVFPPTQSVEILLQKPARPHIELAMIESRGGSEAELLDDAREKARLLGADALVRTDTERRYHPPITMYDPWYDPFYFGPYPHRYWGPWGPWGPWDYPWGPYRVIPGGYEYTLKAIAIRYSDRDG